MMRTVLVLCALAALASPALALEMGDPAPALTIKEWVKGEAVDLAAAKGAKVVIVEFWATWCGPCKVSIPHLTELQKEYADRGVVVIGVTSEDPRNSLDQVKEFVAEMGDKMAYTVAFDDGEKTNTAWMVAAGQTGIPTAFVVDKEGVVAWIGHPMNGLDQVVASILEGKYDVARAKALKPIQDEIDRAGRSSNWAALLAGAEKMVPIDAVKGNLYKCWALSEQGKPAEAFAAATASLEAAQLASDYILVAGTIREIESKDHDFAGLALQAIGRAVELEPTNVQAWQVRFRLLVAKGQEEEAKTSAAKFVELANDDANELNNFAWALLTEDPFKGKWNELALKASTRSNDLTKNESWMYLDTLALAKFETGAAAEAVTLEEKSIELAKKEGVGGQDLKGLEDALKRFRQSFE